MKIIIFTEGGRKIGFGHVSRCLALYEAFKERGIVPDFIINGDPTIRTIIRGKRFHILDWLKEKNKLFKIVKEADIVIIDSYLAEKFLYDRISEITYGRLVAIDDYNRLAYPKGIVVNPSIYGDKLNYPKKDGVVYLLGKDYIILRKEFWEVPKKVVNKEVKNILVTLGGINHSGLAKRIIDYFKDKFAFKYYLVDSKKDRFTAKEMLNLMLRADICISGGGQTTYELARCGILTIGICFADNQLFNLKSWAKAGFLKFAGWYNDKDLLQKIEEALKILDYKKRIKISQIGKKFVDGQGAKRAAKEILTYAKNQN